MGCSNASDQKIEAIAAKGAAIMIHLLGMICRCISFSAKASKMADAAAIKYISIAYLYWSLFRNFLL